MASGIRDDQLPPISGKKRGKTDYMYRPPAIKPNYGKVKESLLPKTNMSSVLLFENNMQENVLNVKLKYIAKERQTYRFAFRKTRYAFIDRQNHRRKWHELWEHGYKKMTDAFIERYGSLYTPEPEPEEVDPFFINARLAPPINVLCFYLDSQEPDKTVAKPQKNQSLFGRHKTSITEYLHDHERLIGRRGTDMFNLYDRSIEDPRFRNLAESLVPPGFQTMGYLQLSPTFSNVGANLSKKPRLAPRHRDLTLPDFYRRGHMGSRDSDRPKSSDRQPSIQKDSTFLSVEDKHSSVSEWLSNHENDFDQPVELTKDVAI